ncbi:MAG TPA: serine hydrolase domain-containing protein [Dyella sp.]|uniref:serine hydrolase domain-containing protein n=1 Tax=Dyella sp. TaxID=1869338 RepID=UPI002F941B10
MKRWLAFGLALAGMAPLHAATSDYDAAFEQTMARYRLPGLAVGVIDHGKVVYTRTAGELAAGSGHKIDRDTLFKIASNSKAMTAALLARLVDEGKLRWDDPVTKYLPAFRMADPWVTAHMQVRDLLVHHSGLGEGAGDLMLWPEPNRFTRGDIIAGLAYLKPKYEFRAGYAYDNLLYVVAGEVAAAAGGAPYDVLLRREVFEPLGLARCQVGAWKRDAVGNVAQPHDARATVIDADGENVPDIVSAAAGGVRCSLDDMLAWAKTWVAPDRGQTAWLSTVQREAVWAPQTPMPISARRRAWDRTQSYAYALGWRLADVDGQWTVSHTGTLSGMYSSLTLLPQCQAGFVVLINADAEDARSALSEALLKTFTDPGQGHTVEAYAKLIDEETKATAHTHGPDTSDRTPVTPGELATRTGQWRDAWFGDVSLCADGKRVRFASLKSPRLSGTVVRSHHRYMVAWDHGNTDAWLSWTEGAQPAMRLAKVDPKADFSDDFEDLEFHRRGACAP